MNGTFIFSGTETRALKAVLSLPFCWAFHLSFLRSVFFLCIYADTAFALTFSMILPFQKLSPFLNPFPGLLQSDISKILIWSYYSSEVHTCQISLIFQEFSKNSSSSLLHWNVGRTATTFSHIRYNPDTPGWSMYCDFQIKSHFF